MEAKQTARVWDGWEWCSCGRCVLDRATHNGQGSPRVRKDGTRSWPHDQHIDSVPVGPGTGHQPWCPKS